MQPVTLLLPQAAATAAVLAGFLAAASVASAPRVVRWLMLSGALVVLVVAAGVRLTQTRTGLLPADMAGVTGLTLLAVRTGLQRMPSGLARMARAAGAGRASAFFHTVLRPAFWRAAVCWVIGQVLAAQDFGLLARAGLASGIGPTVALGGCAVLGLAMLLGPRQV